MNKIHDTGSVSQPAGEPNPAYFIRKCLVGVTQAKWRDILSEASKAKDPTRRALDPSSISKWEAGGGISSWWSAVIRDVCKARQANGLLKREWQDSYLHADGIPEDGYKPPAAHAVRGSVRGASSKASADPIKDNPSAHRTDVQVAS
ncbi:hypothetical protein [Pyruvatibacter sp.]